MKVYASLQFKLFLKIQSPTRTRDYVFDLLPLIDILLSMLLIVREEKKILWRKIILSFLFKTRIIYPSHYVNSAKGLRRGREKGMNPLKSRFFYPPPLLSAAGVSWIIVESFFSNERKKFLIVNLLHTLMRNDEY